MPIRQFLPDTLDLCLINVRDLSHTELAHLQTLLNDEEQAKAQRFMQADDRLRYTVAHGALRQLLRDYLDSPTSELRFTIGPHGKPELTDAACQFNLSHSGDYVLIGLSQIHPLGVDVEQKKPISDYHKLAKRFFHPQEYKAIAALPSAQSLDAFYRCWNRKEAVAKTTGQGLQMGFHSFQVSTSVSAWVRFENNELDGARWTLQDLPLSDSQHVACWATQQPGCRSRLIPLKV